MTPGDVVDRGRRPPRRSSATGAWIYYNTHVLNTYLTRNEAQRLAADYEKTYKPLAGAPQPKVTAADVKADIYPDGAARAHRRHAVARQPQRAADHRRVRAVSARAHATPTIEFSVPARARRRPSRSCAGITTGSRRRWRRARRWTSASTSTYGARGLPQRGRRSDGARQRHVPQSGPDAGDAR